MREIVGNEKEIELEMKKSELAELLIQSREAIVERDEEIKKLKTVSDEYERELETASLEYDEKCENTFPRGEIDEIYDVFSK